MAITRVQSGQTAGAANASTIAITAATAGNLVCSFFSQSNTNTPTCSLGGTALTVHATKALFNASAGSVWFACGIAAGGETSVTWTPGTSATGHGLCFWELAGAANPFALDFTPAVHTDNLSAVTGGLAVTTTVAGSVVLIGVGGSTSSGTIGAWTGTNVATNIGTAAARCFGGSFITTSTVSSTFTANWATSGVKGMLGVALQPAAAGASKPIAGSAAGAASCSGAVNQTNAAVAGAAAGAAAASGAVTQTNAIFGSANGVATTAGQVNQTNAAVAGAAAGAAAAAGQVTVIPAGGAPTTDFYDQTAETYHVIHHTF